MSYPSPPRGIKGLIPRQSLGAHVTIGRKDGRAVKEKDRFHIVAPYADGDVKPKMPAFDAFNDAPVERRKTLYGTIVHATEEECFDYGYQAYKGPDRGKQHPLGLPWCRGNGEIAHRWQGGEPENFREIQCPGRRCEFQQGPEPRCRGLLRLMFRIQWDRSWPKMPTPTVMLNSHSINGVKNLVGFFGDIRRMAGELGMPECRLFGYPFMLQLVIQTRAKARTRFPVINIAPLQDAVSFFRDQRIKLLELQAGAAGLPRITDPELNTPAQHAYQYSLVSPPGIGQEVSEDDSE